ncbi:hypothetical protein Ga0003345_2454 [Idiomarinaceae bacterium HL-53]|nr:hypothetical protein Ga0003345_2454 [Idiomarinaceae bacterium HL-53]
MKLIIILFSQAVDIKGLEVLMSENHEFQEAAGKRHILFAVIAFVGIASLTPVLRLVQLFGAA